MSDTPYQSLYTQSQALLIGINSYSDSRFVPLGEAESDAQALGGILSQEPHNFDVRILLGEEATKAAILDALFALRASQPDDRLLVYFAGHGYSLTDMFGRQTGYLAAADTLADRDYTALELDTVTDLRRHTPAKHISFIFDACFSGQALGLTRAPSVAANAYMTRRAYQVISAGAGDQTVADYGSMTGLLIEALKMDLAGLDGVFTIGDLGSYLQQTMAADSGQMQIPQFGHLKGSQGGDFVLLQHTGPRLAHDVETTLRSSSPNVRLGGVAELIHLASSEEDLEIADLARERLELISDDDPDERVRSAAARFFAEPEPEPDPMLEEAQIAEVRAYAPVEAVYPETGRKLNPLIFAGAGGLLIAVIVLGIVLMSGGPDADPEQQQPAAAEILQTEEPTQEVAADLALTDEVTAEATEVAEPTIEPTASPLTGAILFEDDLESGTMDKWNPEMEGWDVFQDETGNNVLRGTAPNTDVIWVEIGEISWENYTIDLRIKPIETGLAGLANIELRALSANSACDGIIVHFDNRAASGTPNWLGYWPNWDGCPKLQDTFTSTFEPGNWYRVRIEVYQTSVVAYIDGRLVASIDDATIPDGKVVLGVDSGNTVYYDDIRVTELHAP